MQQEMKIHLVREQTERQNQREKSVDYQLGHTSFGVEGQCHS